MMQEKVEEGVLPMALLLRGDESYFTDFQLSADDVMLQLGIKRSRLNQIAGKELRVGRTRQGRYIKPIFRQCDVDDYAQWTRATATHKKSSDMITQASDVLVSQSDHLISSFRKQTQRLEKWIERHLSQQDIQVKHRLNFLFDDLTRHLSRWMQPWMQQFQNLQEHHLHIKEEMSREQAHLDRLSLELKRMISELKSIQEQIEKLQTPDKNFPTHFNEFGKRLISRQRPQQLPVLSSKINISSKIDPLCRYATRYGVRRRP